MHLAMASTEQTKTMTLEISGNTAAGKHSSPFRMIASQEALAELARRLEKESIIAVDMEADSMYHFHEKVCLVQVGTRSSQVLIDPLAVPDFSCLRETFANPDIIKVFHGADYDIRCLHRDFGITVENLFDTQLACRFLGITATGLEAVIHDRFGVCLEKKYQKKDWSQRPLPPEMLEYAASDTEYLIPLAEMLMAELSEKGRLEWVREECDLLSRVRSSQSDDEPLFLRFKGAGRMNSRTLAVLESLLRLRLEVAEKKDRPAFKVFSNHSIHKIAASKPTNVGRLENLNVLSHRQAMMYGKDIVERVKACLHTPESELPVYPRKKAPVLPPNSPKRVKAIKSWRNRVAKELEIDPALICNKSLMTNIAAVHPKEMADFERVEDMKEWQKRAFGGDILRVLAKLRKNG